MIKNSLNLRQTTSQTLMMTPKLQQAIRLLQLSAEELEQEVQDNLDKNPMLEAEENNHDPITDSVDENDSSYTDNKNDDETHNWDTGNYSHKSSYSCPENYTYEGETSYDLKDHLLWQLNLTSCTKKINFIAQIVIDGINDSGYLTENDNDILSAAKQEYQNVSDNDIKQAILLVQQMEPAGVGSRSVQESLLIQLSRKNFNSPESEVAKQIIQDGLKLLGQHDLKALKKLLKIKKDDELNAAIQIIRGLEPHPGNFLPQTKSEFIIPDVITIKKNGIWHAMLNPATSPRLKLNQSCLGLSEQVRDPSDIHYFKSCIQEASWFIQSLNKRNETLLKVAECIVSHQQEFFEKGESAMRPLILNNVAEETSIHESTASRVTTKKYIYTPRGTYELKFFFSSHVNTENGEEYSSTAIRALIKKLITDESKKHPLSDSKLSNILQEQGIIAARRTVAKYRESLNIPSSNERRRIG